MALETKELTLGGYKTAAGEVEDRLYILTKFPATKGLQIQMKLAEGRLDPELVRDVIVSSVAVGSVKMDAKRFDDHFSGRYKHMMDLFNEVVAFNFDENFTEDDSSESN